MNIAEHPAHGEQEEGQAKACAEELLWLGPVFTQTPDPAFAWVQPLRNAVIRQMMAAPDLNVKSELMTVWGKGSPTEDLPKHEAYCAYITELIREQAPALLPMICLAKGHLIASPGLFCIRLPDEGGDLHVPELLHFTHFLPWATTAEASNPH